MKMVAIIRTASRATAPPMIPSSWPFVRTLLDEVDVGLAFGIAVAVGLTFAMTPLGAVLLATSVGNVGVEAVVMVSVSV